MPIAIRGSNLNREEKTTSAPYTSSEQSQSTAGL
jgi:hypothetical protein